MVYKIADNIISSLGNTTEDNYIAVKEGCTKLSLQEGLWNIPEPFMASLFDDSMKRTTKEGFSSFESFVLLSVQQALAETDIDPAKDNVVFILSTTKGNIDLLKNDKFFDEDISPSVSAQRVAAEIGIRSVPIVVCNACISGLSAVILAQRLLSQAIYDYAIVCGCDIVNRFVVSGFQSFKILSNTPCRPFDIERTGLNLGDAVATIILSREKNEGAQWAIEGGVVRNDASHISTPSNKGEGLYRALKKIIQGRDINDVALINAHGTGTLFNDQMEAVAIDRAGLSTLPINALKGNYGHTMGAAGVLELVLTMKAIDDGVILQTKGFEELGVSRQVEISSKQRFTNKTSFIKILSGFGGCNATIIASKNPLTAERNTLPQLRKTHIVEITPRSVVVDGQLIATDNQKIDLALLYKQYVSNYPKFYKMDMLSRLGFIATELLLNAEREIKKEDREDRAIVFFNHSSSIVTDKHFLSSIEDKDNYYPSPASFVYTLPNIVTGEIAIRNHYYGETAFYILPSKDDALMTNIMGTLLNDDTTKSIIGGWLDYGDEEHFEADISLYES